MYNFIDFFEANPNIMVSEELHSKLQRVLDSKIDPENKLNAFTQHARLLLKDKEETGLENSTPKKGSSRAVFFPKDEKKVHIDGQETHIPTVVKIAYPGHLDKYKKRDEALLGEHQNQAEADHFIKNSYGMLSEDHEGHYKTNPHGVLAPVLGNHPEHHHLEMGRVSPITKAKFKELTKSDSHPKGLKFDDMYHALNKEYSDAHGGNHYTPASYTEKHHDHVMSHPFVSNLYDMMLNSEMHPGDLRPANMGVWKHPITGKEHPVVSDYGYNKTIASEYTRRRRREYGQGTPPPRRPVTNWVKTKKL